MRDYICLNNQRVMLTKEQVSKIRKIFNTQERLGDVSVGDVFTIGELEFVVLEHAKETTAVIFNGLVGDDIAFGKTNDFRTSNVRNICNAFAYEICTALGTSEPLVEHTVDLTAADGLKDYGKMKLFVSLLTTELYRRYVDILDRYKVGNWWLATAFSAPTHGNTNWVNVVASSGCIANFSCYKKYGVRPFCILNSDTLVSV